MRVAVLGAGGTITPAIVRDLAESPEVEELLLLDLDLDRAEARGVHAAERCIYPDLMFDELEARGVSFEIEETTNMEESKA